MSLRLVPRYKALSVSSVPVVLVEAASSNRRQVNRKWLV
jgi:hypothetical protein